MESKQAITPEQAREAAKVMSAYRQQAKAVKQEEARLAALAEAADRRKWRLLAMGAGLSTPVIALAINFWQVTLSVCAIAIVTLVWRVGGLVGPVLAKFIETNRTLAVLKARRDPTVSFMMDNPDFQVTYNA